MKNAKKIICTLVLAALMLTVMGTSVFAAEEGSAWLQVDASSENVTVVSVLANTSVTDALITINYDATNLSYVSLEVNSDCVAYNSVNADEPGVIKLAWVSTGEYEAQDVALFTLSFNGMSETQIVMSGELFDAEGNALTIGQTLYGADLTELKKAVLLAQGLTADHYTEESFAAMLSALDAAQTLLVNKYALQEDVDATAEALNAAVDALVLSADGLDEEIQALEKAKLKAQALDKVLYTEESYARVQAALAAAEELMANGGTSEEYQAAADAINAAIRDLELSPDAPATGDKQAMPAMLIMALAAVGVAVVAILFISKKGRCAK